MCVCVCVQQLPGIATIGRKSVRKLLKGTFGTISQLTSFLHPLPSNAHRNTHAHKQQEGTSIVVLCLYHI